MNDDTELCVVDISFSHLLGLVVDRDHLFQSFVKESTLFSPTLESPRMTAMHRLALMLVADDRSCFLRRHMIGFQFFSGASAAPNALVR